MPCNVGFGWAGSINPGVFHILLYFIFILYFEHCAVFICSLAVFQSITIPVFCILYAVVQVAVLVLVVSGGSAICPRSDIWYR